MIRGATSWMDHAACANRGNRRFYSDDEAQQLAALRVCAECPVRHDCLIYALDGEERFGVWGGLTTKQRLQLLGARPVVRRCVECANTYETPRDESRHRSLYCTTACKDAAKRRVDNARKFTETHSCLVCGTASAGSKTCSAYCRFVYRRMTLRKTSEQ
jgi:hypothetical protein